MTTALYTHPACLDHRPGSTHPERPERLRAILEALSAPEFRDLKRQEAPLAALQHIHPVHDPDHVGKILAAIPKSGALPIDADTWVSPGSGEAALRAAGAMLGAIDDLMAGRIANAFCAVRPPGHHAERRRAMGFCLFNNAAIGAAYARRVHGLERIAILDFDVHHGNGTQHFAERDPAYFYASCHEMPLYPGTGAAKERGIGNILNAPLPPGAGGLEFRAAIEDILLPAIADFSPAMIIISAGFDAHRADPLASLELTEADFAWATRAILGLAKGSAKGRVLSTLEGGYDLEALAASAAAHVRALMAGH